MSTFEFDTEVMRQHRQDCIALRVPQSGDSVLDSLIREARRMDFAKAAMRGILSTEWARNADREQIAQWSVEQSADLLAALESTGGGLEESL